MYCIIEYTDYIKLPTINAHYFTKNIHTALAKAQQLCKENTIFDSNDFFIININKKRRKPYVQLLNKRIIAQYCCYYVKPLTKRQIDTLFKHYIDYETDDDISNEDNNKDTYWKKIPEYTNNLYNLEDDIENNIKGIVENNEDDNNYITIKDLASHYSRKQINDLKVTFNIDANHIVGIYNQNKRQFECCDYEKTFQLLKYMIMTETIAPLTNMFDKSLIRSQQIFAIVSCDEI